MKLLIIPEAIFKFPITGITVHLIISNFNVILLIPDTDLMFKQMLNKKQV